MRVLDVAPSSLESKIEPAARPVDDELGGSVFRSSGSVSPTLSKVLELAGWVDGDWAPDPVRLMAGATRRGIKVGMTAQALDWPRTNIPGRLYGELVLNSVHPVSVAYLFNYVHDISDDHYPAPFVVGQELFDILRPPGKKPDLIKVARAYDVGTMSIAMYIGAYANSVKRGGEVFGDPHLSYVLEEGASKKDLDARLIKLKSLVHSGLEELGII